MIKRQKQVEAEPISREHWNEILDKEVKPEAGHLIRRKYPRMSITGIAALTLDPTGVPAQQPLGMAGFLLQISQDGCMIRTERSLEPTTPVDLELRVGDEAFLVKGRVVHSTQTIGGYKTGIALTFDDDPTDESGTSGD